MLCKVKWVYLIQDSPALNYAPSYYLPAYPEVHIAQIDVNVQLLEVYSIVIYLYISQVFYIRLRLSRSGRFYKGECLYRCNCAYILDIISKVIIRPYPCA